MLKPVVKEVRVSVAPAVAFEQFTRGMGGWWPLRHVSVFEEQSLGVRFEEWEGGGLAEVSARGLEADWGRVLVWQPPERVAFTWHPGRPAETAQCVEVRFISADGGTVVRLEQSRWEVLGAAAVETRASYETGWGGVLNAFATGVEAAAIQPSTGPPARSP